MALFFLILFLTSLNPSLLARESTAKLEQEVAEVRRLQESTGKILAETVQNVASLQQGVQELKGLLEETQHFFKEGTTHNEKILREFDYRLTGIEERMSLLGGQLNDLFSKPESQPAKGKGRQVEKGQEVLYRRAMAEINLQNYRGALSLFDDFLKQYPRSSLSGNAQYWKGEALYASKDYPKAILEFQKVVKHHAKSEKVPGAVLKQGYCFYEMQNYADSKAFLQKVVTDHPTSGEAAQAKERLHKIEQVQTRKTPLPKDPIGIPKSPPQSPS